MNAGVVDPGMFEPPDPKAVAAFTAARSAVMGQIADACRRSGREPGAVTLVAVTKTVDAARIRAAVAAGLTILGENRVQEAASKVDLVPGASWHMVGPLQGNKARRAVELFAEIETVDTLDLAARLDRIVRELWAASGEAEPGDPQREARRLAVLVQVNVDTDATKAGFDPVGLARELPALLALSALRVTGLMTVGRLVGRSELARPTFVRLREVSERLRGADPRLGPGLSMGMSDDFAVAVEEGATIVRVGRALFGDRPSV